MIDKAMQACCNIVFFTDRIGIEYIERNNKMKKSNSSKLIKSILYSSILGGNILIGGSITHASETDTA